MRRHRVLAEPGHHGRHERDLERRPAGAAGGGGGAAALLGLAATQLGVEDLGASRSETASSRGRRQDGHLRRAARRQALLGTEHRQGSAEGGRGVQARRQAAAARRHAGQGGRARIRTSTTSGCPGCCTAASSARAARARTAAGAGGQRSTRARSRTSRAPGSSARATSSASSAPTSTTRSRPRRSSRSSGPSRRRCPGTATSGRPSARRRGSASATPRNNGNVTSAMNGAAHVLAGATRSATSRTPRSGRRRAIADVKADSALIMVAHAGRLRPARRCSRACSGMKPEQVRVQFREGAGCYGKNLQDDAGAGGRGDVAARRQAGAGAVHARQEHGWDFYGPASWSTSAAASTRTARSSRTTTSRSSRAGTRSRRPRSSSARPIPTNAFGGADHRERRLAVHDHEPPRDRQVACRSGRRSQASPSPGPGGAAGAVRRRSR